MIKVSRLSPRNPFFSTRTSVLSWSRFGVNLILHWRLDHASCERKGVVSKVFAWKESWQTLTDWTWGLVVLKHRVAWTAQSHYLNQCWNIVNWTLGNKFQWNFNRNSNIFIQENAFQNVVCDMTSILSRPQCDNIVSRRQHMESLILINIDSGDGLLHARCHAITCTNAVPL